MDGFVRTLYQGEDEGEWTVDYIIYNLTGFDADRVWITDGLLYGATVTEQHNVVDVRGMRVDLGAIPVGGKKHCSLRIRTQSVDTGAYARLEGEVACSVLRSVTPQRSGSHVL